ncbi:MAG: Calx-beta domain-containing protein [Bacteriovoracaceae bacterium]|jgi:hypothetical protein|nr:Calx-beta domain-containing protein [Bacteriovoracaceae bacterium]
MKNILFIFSLLSLLFLGGCLSPEVPQTELEFKEIVPYDSFSTTQSEKNLRAVDILQAKCMKCHTGHHDKWRAYDNIEDWKQDPSITAGYPERSSLITRLKGFGYANGDMPKLMPELTQEEHLILKDWIQAMEEEEKTIVSFKDTSFVVNEKTGSFSLEVEFNKPAIKPFVLKLKEKSVTESISYTIDKPLLEIIKGQSTASFVFNIVDNENIDGVRDYFFDLEVTSPGVLGSAWQFSLKIIDDEVSVPPEDMRFLNAYNVIQNKCISCHTSSIHDVFKDLNTSKRWVLNNFYIKPKDAKNSLLVKRLKNYGSDMPVGSAALSSAELKYIEEWIDNLSEINNPVANFSESLREVVEGAKTIKLKISLNKNIESTESFRIVVLDKSTLTTQEYSLSAQEISFSKDNLTQEILIHFKDDTSIENDESLFLKLEPKGSNAIAGLNSIVELRVLDDDSAQNILLNNAAIKINLPDRKFLASFFKVVFGPTVDSNIKKYIHSNIDIFGSKCDIYERTKDPSGNAEFSPMSECMEADYGLEQKTYSSQSSSPVKMAWIIDMCENTIQNDDLAVSHALGNVGLTQSSQLSDENIQKAFEIFYPGKKLPMNAISAFRDLGNVDANKKWKSILTGLCVSPEWMTP